MVPYCSYGGAGGGLLELTCAFLLHHERVGNGLGDRHAGVVLDPQVLTSWVAFQEDVTALGRDGASMPPRRKREGGPIARRGRGQGVARRSAPRKVWTLPSATWRSPTEDRFSKGADLTCFLFSISSFSVYPLIVRGEPCSIAGEKRGTS